MPGTIYFWICHAPNKYQWIQKFYPSLTRLGLKMLASEPLHLLLSLPKNSCPICRLHAHSFYSGSNATLSEKPFPTIVIERTSQSHFHFVFSALFFLITLTSYDLQFICLLVDHLSASTITEVSFCFVHYCISVPRTKPNKCDR